MPQLISIGDKRIAFTGTAWCSRSELQRLVRRRGGTPVTKVSAHTDVLVRGDMLVPTRGEFGVKEGRAAELIREGYAVVVVQDLEFRKLLEQGRRARLADVVAGQPIEWLRGTTKRDAERAARFRGALDREHSALGRAEQGYLRGLLFKGEEDVRCSLCGRQLPVELLVAAHIKPRADCVERERRDFTHIAFALCLLGCDALYERGLVAVEEGGRVVVAKTGSKLLASHLVVLSRRRCHAWNPDTADYFRWHRARRFRG